MITSVCWTCCHVRQANLSLWTMTEGVKRTLLAVSNKLIHTDVLLQTLISLLNFVKELSAQSDLLHYTITKCTPQKCFDNYFMIICGFLKPTDNHALNFKSASCFMLGQFETTCPITPEIVLVLFYLYIVGHFDRHDLKVHLTPQFFFFG